MKKLFNESSIENICRILGDLTTGSKITNMLNVLGYFDHDYHLYGKPVSSKWKRLYDVVTSESNKSQNIDPLFKIVEYIMQPINFVNEPDDWRSHLKAINSILIFHGYELNDSGKVVSTIIASTMSDAQKRLKSFEQKLKDYEIHPEVLRYCKVENMNENYFHAIFEASKGVSQRIRNISELDSDGNELIHEAFSTKQPVILIKDNMLESKTDKSLYNGLKNLLETIVSLYRNPKAHTPKLYDPTSETDAITAYTLMSLAHRILDNCINVRDFSN